MVTAAPTIFPRVGYSIISFLMFINTVFSVFNNGVVIAVMLMNPSLLQPMNVFIFGLAVSDLMIGLCGSLVATITNYHGSYFIGHAACIFQGFSVNYFGKWNRKGGTLSSGSVRTTSNMFKQILKRCVLQFITYTILYECNTQVGIQRSSLNFFTAWLAKNIHFNALYELYVMKQDKVDYYDVRRKLGTFFAGYLKNSQNWLK